MLVDDYEQYPDEKTDDIVVSRSGSDEPEPEPAPSAADRTFSCITLPHFLHRTTSHERE